MVLLVAGARRAQSGVAAGLAASVSGARLSKAAAGVRWLSVLVAPKGQAVAGAGAAAAVDDHHLHHDVTSGGGGRPKADFMPSANTDTRKGICVVGCGRMGEIRTEGILANPGTRLVSVVDSDKERATALARNKRVPAFW